MIPTQRLTNRARMQVQNYEAQVQNLQASSRWLDYPSSVSIETYAFCNAACIFCPYPTLDRKGERMPTPLFTKIIDELAKPEGSVLPAIVLCRVNEPFLDKRYFDFCHYVAAKLPETKINHFTNMTPLNGKNLDALFGLNNTGLLKISFNDHRPEEYEKSMKLPFEKAYTNARHLHDRMAAGEAPFPVRMGRVGDGTAADLEFIRWVKQTFPLFRPMVTARFDWIGRVDVETSGLVPQIGCRQWFQLHFLADGREAFCCIDSDGSYASGNARLQNAIDIYNAPERRALRERILAREEVRICALCTALV